MTRLTRHLLPALALLLALQGAAVQAAEDFSPAERALFMDDQFTAIKPPVVLNYSFRKQGSLEPGFDDTVAITLRRGAEGKCCAASTEFLHGDRALKLPEIESAQGNPAILYFLERDIREMQRLTKGQQNYFRKRIRMAVYQSATLRQVQVAWNGQTVAGQEIIVSPYVDDPLRARFENLTGKQYIFTMSPSVPGGVHSIRTRVPGATPDAPALLSEELQFQSSAPATALAPAGPSPTKAAAVRRPPSTATP